MNLSLSWKEPAFISVHKCWHQHVNWLLLSYGLHFQYPVSKYVSLNGSRILFTQLLWPNINENKVCWCKEVLWICIKQILRLRELNHVGQTLMYVSCFFAVAVWVLFLGWEDGSGDCINPDSNSSIQSLSPVCAKVRSI